MAALKPGAPFRIASEAARRGILRLGLATGLATAGTLSVAPAVDARVTRIQIATKESPTFGGYSFPGIGQYGKIAGRAFGEIDPRDPKNAVIVDIQLAPRNKD